MADDEKGVICDHDDNKWKGPGWNWLERLLDVRVLNNGDWVLVIHPKSKSFWCLNNLRGLP